MPLENLWIARNLCLATLHNGSKRNGRLRESKFFPSSKRSVPLACNALIGSIGKILQKLGGSFSFGT